MSTYFFHDQYGITSTNINTSKDASALIQKDCGLQMDVQRGGNSMIWSWKNGYKNNIFAWSSRRKDLYMQQPEGYQIPENEQQVCLLKMPLYRLKQSPIGSAIKGLIFSCLKKDQCVYFKRLLKQSPIGSDIKGLIFSCLKKWPLCLFQETFRKLNDLSFVLYPL